MLQIAQQTASEWIVSLSWAFWALAALVGLLGVWLLYRGLLRDRPKGKRRCRKCWYDMTGVPGLTCPECGRTHNDERQLQRRRRYRGIAVCGMLLLVFAVGIAWTPRVAHRGLLASLPTIMIAAAAAVYDTPEARLLEKIQSRAVRPNPDGMNAAARWLTSIAVSRRLRTVDVTAYEANRTPSGQSSFHGVLPGSRCIVPAIQLAIWLCNRDPEHPVAPSLLARGLENPDTAARLEVLRGLGHAKMLNQRIADAVAPELDSPDARFGRAAWYVTRSHYRWFIPYAEMAARAELAYDTSFDRLEEMGLPGAEQLLKLIDHPARGLDAITSLITMRNYPSGAGLRLAEYAAGTPDAARRNDAIFAACKAAPNDPAVVQTAFRLALTDEDADVRHAALYGLSRSSDYRGAFVAVLTKALADPASNVRSFAAWQLGEFGATAAPALEALASATNDPEPRVSAAATKSIDQIRLAVAERTPVSSESTR